MTTEATTPIVVADDHALLRRGLVDVIRQSAHYRVVAEASDGAAALEAIRSHAPRIAVLDIEMPGLTGIAVAEAARDEGLDTAVVLLTMHDDAEILERALAAGVKGYVLKDGALTDIVTCLNLVGAGRFYVSAGVAGALVERRARLDGAEAGGRAILGRLTPTEQKVLRLVAANRTTDGIARDLGISPKTVENHRTRIAAKLDVHGPQALLRFALEHRAELEEA
jgi:DNA-binding NarL/FixJ family response regulator